MEFRCNSRPKNIALQVLAQHSGNVVTHQHLLREVWGEMHVKDAHYLKIFDRKLRQKIEKIPAQPQILTEGRASPAGSHPL
jgi:two-component system KDP operon response regulator KdpE